MMNDVTPPKGTIGMTMNCANQINCKQGREFYQMYEGKLDDMARGAGMEAGQEERELVLFKHLSLQKVAQAGSRHIETSIMAALPIQVPPKQFLA
eukprot:scaffold8178_cov49-Attheya_sp.AAC.4